MVMMKKSKFTEIQIVEAINEHEAGKFLFPDAKSAQNCCSIS